MNPARDGGRPPALAAALRYIERGWPVLPLFSIDERGCECRRGCAQPGKHPRVMGGAHAATLDPDQVREWWRMWPSSNVGIGCADLVVSGKLWNRALRRQPRTPGDLD